MAKNLLIVESPAKAKTIQKILGDEFDIKSCYGHIRDLDKEDMGVDIAHHYQPIYVIPPDKKKIVEDLKKLARKASEVWLATDEDREGEAISWHLAEVLGLDPLTTKRIVFHEITRPAIEKAVKEPRTIDMNLVNAQQARRILDRLVGFELSPLLWRKVSMKNALSAGRVQSVAVRLIVEREREIMAFQPESSFQVEALFAAPDARGREISFKATGRERIATPEEARQFLASCVGAIYTVRDIEVKPSKRSPAPPFTTSTLQQEASRKLGYSVSKTMLFAQKLYENGYITYMRTDSVNLSETAHEAIRKVVQQQYGENYYQYRVFKNKNENAQEAHEAIRPTDMTQTTIPDPDTQKLYELIWKRTVASQMSDAQLEKTIVHIGISQSPYLLIATGEVLKFDGFLKLYLESRDEEENEEETGMLPAMEKGQQLQLLSLRAVEKFTRPPARYTEASLVKKLEELGIGRPSTYAPIISTIQKRKYVEKRDKEGTPRSYRIFTISNQEVLEEEATEITGAEKGKLFPTDLGMLVTDFLNQHFQNIMDYGFTARIEEEFDEIARGQKQWNEMIDSFYQPFHRDVEKTLETAEKVKGERYLGDDPQTGKPVYARMGRYGPMIQIGQSDDAEKPRFAKLKKDQSIETITLEQALELFKLPRNIGQIDGKDVIINIGRFGPYALYDGKFYSLSKDMDPYTVGLDEVAALIAEKKANSDKKLIKQFDGTNIQVLRGPYGPYLKKGNKNYRLPKEWQQKPEELTLADCEQIIESAAGNGKSKRAAKKNIKPKQK
ncbi:MAG: type I DNA topoisomerase [Thermoflavifilum sp.]|nr:type I DNA topoisomerase [Thermoflavifilum sp.]